MARLARFLLALGLMAALLTAGVAGEVLAAPLGQSPQAVITSPAAHAVVHGRVQILGTATHPNFQFYKVEYSLAGSQQWVMASGEVKKTPVINGVLDIWDTTRVPDGTYSLRLRMVDNTGNYRDHEVVPIVVSNTAPTLSPTPTITPEMTLTHSPTPKATPPLVLTPVIIIGQPTPTSPATLRPSPLPSLSPTITSTPQPTVPVVARPSPLTGSGSLSLAGIGRAFLLGASMSMALFAIIGLFSLLRKVLE